jgi:hypothetical protein
MDNADPYDDISAVELFNEVLVRFAEEDEGNE